MRAVVLFGDLACPWASLAVHRFRAARARLGLDGQVVLDVRAFPLEIINGRPTPKHILDKEIPIVGALSPELGWRGWQADPSTWPVSVLAALEAVEAAKDESLQLAEDLDAALRRALFVDSRCVSVTAVVLEVARGVAGLDVDRIERTLHDGSARGRMLGHHVAAGKKVKGSPHLFLPDGTDAHNPGIRHHWTGGDAGSGELVVDSEDPSVYDDLVRRASSVSSAV